MHIQFPNDSGIIPEVDKTHFVNTVLRACQWERLDRTVTVYIGKRTESGWLEHTIIVKNLDGKQLIHIGAIQRKPTCDSEFCS